MIVGKILEIAHIRDNTIMVIYTNSNGIFGCRGILRENSLYDWNESVSLSDVLEKWY